MKLNQEIDYQFNKRRPNDLVAIDSVFLTKVAVYYIALCRPKQNLAFSSLFPARGRNVSPNSAASISGSTSVAGTQR